MSVQLEAIQFNHDPLSARRDALNIRKNASEVVAFPEWQRGNTVNPDDSVAAYALAEVRGQRITIRAQFSRLDPSLQRVEVRAIDPTGNRNILGAVGAKQVTFSPSGKTGFVLFTLQGVRIGTVGVSIQTVTWQWQFRTSPQGSWTDFATTNHKIFTVLDVPEAPWVQEPFNVLNSQLPWTDVMDYACRWASGAKTLDDASAKVTQAVYDLGHSVVEYGCAVGGITQYTSLTLPYFNCTAFLERLDGGIGNGPYVNCSDCATIVSTFSNILGCSLWQSRMYSGTPFALNPILAIGSNVWQSACNWPGFIMHEVAWKAPCTENDNVYDACLQVNGNANPALPPFIPIQPINMRFGAVGQGPYRDRLASTLAAQVACQPQPSSAVRRLVR